LLLDSDMVSPQAVQGIRPSKCLDEGLEIVMSNTYSLETPPGVLHLDLGLPAQKRHELLRPGPEEGHENNQMGGISLL